MFLQGFYQTWFLTDFPEMCYLIVTILLHRVLALGSRLDLPLQYCAYAVPEEHSEEKNDLALLLDN